MTDNFLQLKNIQKKYIDASKNIQVLNGVNLSLSKNNIVSLIGPLVLENLRSYIF